MLRVGAMVVALLISACATAPTPTPTPRPIPAGWTYRTWSDPAMHLAVPPEWQDEDPRQTFDPSEGSLSPAEVASIESTNELATSGKMRLRMTGQMPTLIGGFDTAAVVVIIESGDASIDAFVQRQRQLDTAVFGAGNIDQTTVSLASGPAVRLAYAFSLGSAPTAQEVDYLMMLPDGRSMTVAILGFAEAAVPEVVSTFAELVIDTLGPS